MSVEASIVHYEPCPKCTDGTCGACGPASSEHAAPGVRFVTRQIRFVRCPALRFSLDSKPSCAAGCTRCGPAVHPLAAVGTSIEVVEERTGKRWVPSIHLKAPRTVNTGMCSASPVPEERLTLSRSAVTCKRCQGIMDNKGSRR